MSTVIRKLKKPMKWKNVVWLAVSAFAAVIFLSTFVSDSIDVISASTRLKRYNYIVNNPPINLNITLDSVFVYRAYLDRRGRTPRVRVFAINKCHRNASLLSADVHGMKLPLKALPIEMKCPWHWAAGCKLSSYVHEVDVPGNTNLTEIKLEGKFETRTVPVETIERTKQEGITVCVPPIYWYTDWTKLIFFIEWWHRQQAKEIIFYHHSATREVMTVLDYYKAKNWVTVIPWPSLPSSKSFEPNSQVYRIGHSVAHNDCIMRVNTEYMTLVDIDELIQPLKSSLPQFISKTFQADSTIGSVQFVHHVVQFNPPLIPSPFRFEDVNYSGLQSVNYYNMSAGGKIIGRTNALDRINSHSVNVFRRGKFKQIRTKDAVMLHNRYNFVGAATNRTLERIDLVPDPQWFAEYLESIKRLIFPNGAIFKPETQTKMGNCTASWRQTQSNCMAPVTFCREVIKDAEDWVEATSEEFTVL